MRFKIIEVPLQKIADSLAKIRTRHIILGISLLGLFFRVMNLGSKSLWLDEAFNVAVAKSGIKALWTQTVETHHPPLHFILQRFWMRFGESEIWLRMLPALFGASAIPLIYIFIKKLGRKDAAITAMGLVAFSPLLIWYSQEARPYSFIVAIGLAAMTTALLLFLKPKPMTASLFIIIMIAAFYTHYEMIFLIPLQAYLLIFLVAKKKSGIRAFIYWLVGVLLAGLAFSPWLRTPAARSFLAVLKTGSYPGQILASKLGMKPQILVLILAATALAVLSIGAYCFRILLKKSWFEKALNHGGVRIDIVLFAVMAVLLIASVIPRGYSIKKQIVLFVPYGLLLIGLLWPWEARHRKKIVAVFCFSIICSLINIFAIPKDDWRQVVDFLGKEYRAGDVILLLPSYNSFPFEYYSRGKLPSEGIDLDSYEHKIEALRSDTQRIWLVSNREAFIDPEGKIRTSLVQIVTTVKSVSYYRVQIDLFEPKR